MYDMPRSLIHVDSSRSRGGVRFEPQAELDLHVDLPDVVSRLRSRAETSLLIREPPGPYGIPDFVLLFTNEETLTWRLTSQVPPLLNRVDAGIVGALSAKRALSLPSVAKKTGWHQDTLQRRLRNLVNVGAVYRTRSGALLRAPELVPLGVAVALEMKVSEWRRALRQGRTYSSWCETYVLVMSTLSDRVAEQVRAQVAADRAGLVIGGEWLLYPRRHEHSGRFWGSEYLTAALQDHHPSSEIRRSQASL